MPEGRAPFRRIIIQATRTTSYGEEIRHLYEHGHLTPEISLTGHFKGQHRTVDLDGLLSEIHDAEEEAQRRRQARDGDPPDGEPVPHERAYPSP